MEYNPIFSNGIIIQWGRSGKYTGPGQKKEITLPTSFSNTTYIVTISLSKVSDGVNIDDNLIVLNRTATSFTMYSTSVGATDNGWHIAGDWIAIGY